MVCSSYVKCDCPFGPTVTEFSSCLCLRCYRKREMSHKINVVSSKSVRLGSASLNHDRQKTGGKVCSNFKCTCKGYQHKGISTRSVCDGWPALRPIQPSLQWVPGALFPGVAFQGREADPLLPSTAVVKTSYTPVGLHGLLQEYLDVIYIMTYMRK